MDTKHKQLLKDISKEAVDLDWQAAFSGRTKGNRHLFRVNKIAKYLQKKEGGNIFIVLAGAWIHDVSLAWGSDYNSEFVRKKTKFFLNQFKNMTTSEKDLLIECAVGHEESKNAICIEAKIVHDSDVLDKCGVLGIIRHTWKVTNMMEKRILKKEGDAGKIRDHLYSRKVNLFTKTAKQIAKHLTKEQDLFFKDKDAEKILTQISELAFSGKTSDKIAMFLAKQFSDKKFFTNLENQLKVNYL